MAGRINVGPVVHVLHISRVAAQRFRLPQRRTGRLRARAANGRVDAHLNLPTLLSDHDDSALRVRNSLSFEHRQINGHQF